MQVVLLNISDAERVVMDRRNRAVKVGVGEMKKADVHEAHYRIMRNGTFLALPEEVEIPERVQRALAIMGSVSTTDYSELLQKFWGLVDPDPYRLRPSREEIRLSLRNFVQNLMAAAGTGKPAPSRVTITEQGDAATRTDEEDIGSLTDRSEGDDGDQGEHGEKQPAQPRPQTRKPNPNRPRQTTRSAQA